MPLPRLPRSHARGYCQGMAKLIYAALTSLDVAVGGPALAAHAIRAGLVDEYHVFVTPIIVGGGNPYLPTNVRVSLELIDQRGFDSGMVHVRYRAES
jgi:dihydrofolate reductase